MKSSYFSKGRPCSSRGFTLIELLIVIAIIAILSGIIITNLASSQAKSRDAKRVSDIAQIQLSIEQYFDRCQQYPPASNGTLVTTATSDTCPSGITLKTYISQIPTPPSIQATYQYFTTNASCNSSNPCTDYVLRAQLETNSSALQDSLTDSTKPSGAWDTATCSQGGSAPYNYCIGSK